MRRIKEKIFEFFESNSYYVILSLIFIALIVISLYFNIPNYFYDFYNVNYSSINNNFITFFGIVFGFLFTSLAILFSLNENSFFMKLIKEHHRTQV